MAEYINRRALMEQLQRKKYKVASERYNEGFNDAILKVRSMVHSAPAANVSEIIHGKWAHLGDDEWCCSSCGYVITTDGSWEKPTAKYCSECGAKMDLRGDRNNN